MAHPHSNLIRIVDNIEIDIAALAALTGVIGTGKIDASRAQGFRTLMQRGRIELDGTGVGSGAGGPVFVGFSDQDSLSKIEQAIEADPQSIQDDPAMEQAGRKIFQLGFLSQQDSALAGQNFSKKHRQSFIEATSLVYFAYNTDLNAAISAATQVKIFVEHIGVWLRD